MYVVEVTRGKAGMLEGNETVFMMDEQTAADWIQAKAQQQMSVFEFKKPNGKMRETVDVTEALLKEALEEDTLYVECVSKRKIRFWVNINRVPVLTACK